MSNLNVKLLKNVESKTKIYLAIIAIILIALCINNIAYIIPSIIGYALIIVYTIWVYKRRKSEISNYITDLTINVDSAAKNTLINSPFPIIILETDGNVIWRSSKFNKEFANVGINSYIDDIAKEIKMVKNLTLHALAFLLSIHAPTPIPTSVMNICSLKILAKKFVKKTFHSSMHIIG